MNHLDRHAPNVAGLLIAAMIFAAFLYGAHELATSLTATIEAATR